MEESRIRIATKNLDKSRLERLVREIPEPHAESGNALDERARREPRKIGFLGSVQEAGVTTLVHAVAFHMKRNDSGRGKESVTVLELPLRSAAEGMACMDTSGAGRRVLPYDKIGADRRFAGREYRDVHRLAGEGKPVGAATNISAGINWLLCPPPETHILGYGAGHAQPPLLTTADLVRLADEVTGDRVLCDIEAFAGFDPKELRSLLASMDMICCVIDPFPSKLLAGTGVYERVRELERAGQKTVYVLNKANPGMVMKELKRFLGRTDFAIIPALSTEELCGAEYSCRSAYGSSGEYDAAVGELASKFRHA